MLRPTCPKCGTTLRIDEDDLKYYSQFYCDACDVLLEVVAKVPLQFKVAVEEPAYLVGAADNGDEDDV